MSDEKQDYVKTGRMGGSATLSKYGKDHFREAGKKGGARTKLLVEAGKLMLEGVKHDDRRPDQGSSGTAGSEPD